MTLTKTLFISGTDTDVGKTICCKALLQAATMRQKSTLAYKPIAAGCNVTKGGLRNHDALTLQANASIKNDYDSINPIAFEEPIAPHIAANINDYAIETDLITEGLLALQQQKPDLLLVEGAGGWRLPLSQETLLSDWVVEHKLPVIMVVGMKLGCLNHAMLTYEMMLNDGINVIGWVANQLQSDMLFYEQNLTFLKTKLLAPLIAELPYFDDIGHVHLGKYVNWDLLNFNAI